MSLKVYFFEAFEEEEAALRRFLMLSKISAEFTWKTVQEAGHVTPPADIVCIRTQSQIPIDWASNGLVAILTRSTGYDHVIEYRSMCGNPELPAGYLPLYCHRAVAEHCLLMWSSLLRRLPKQLEQFSTFHRDGITGYEMKGKTLLVVGVGNIGSQVVDIGQGLGMNVMGVDIVRKHSHVRYVPINEVISQADVIACCMNLTDVNKGYFNIDLLRKVKRGCVFVNAARGELSPISDLLIALEEGLLGGVGLDVYEDEKKVGVALRSGENTELSDLVLKLSARNDTICTPHNAFNSHEAVLRKSEQSVESIKHFLESGAFKWQLPE